MSFTPKKANKKSTSKTPLKEEVSWTNTFLLGLKIVFKSFPTMSFPAQEYVRKNWVQQKILSKFWPKTFPDNTAGIDLQFRDNVVKVRRIKEEEKKIKDSYNLLTATKMKPSSIRAEEEIKKRIKQSEEALQDLKEKANGYIKQLAKENIQNVFSIDQQEKSENMLQQSLLGLSDNDDFE